MEGVRKAIFAALTTKYSNVEEQLTELYEFSVNFL